MDLSKRRVMVFLASLKFRGWGGKVVGPLQYFDRDPNNKGRGAGWYYHRGKGYYSKYEIGENSREANIRAKNKARNPFYAHTGDDFQRMKPQYRTKLNINKKSIPPVGIQYKLNAKPSKTRRRATIKKENYTVKLNKKRGRKGKKRIVV